MSSAKPRTWLFYGWLVLFASVLIHFYFGGTFFQGFTALFNPIAQEFGWSYAVVSLAFSLRGFESGLLDPIVGFFVDKFGSRRLLLAGAIIMGLGFWSLSRINALWSFYLVFLILGLGFTLTGGIVTMAAVARWFRHRRSLAMGILTSGFGASGLLLPAVLWFVDQFGWRQAVMMFAVGGWALGIPLSLVVKYPPQEEPSMPKAEASTAANQGGHVARAKVET